MAKRRMKIEFRIPPYVTPRGEWRRLMHKCASAAMREAGVRYGPDDLLELDVRIYMVEPALHVHDVDNRLKDVMDALQGHVGGKGKKSRGLRALIANDSQVWRVVVEKQKPPGQSHGLGHVTIRRYKPGAGRVSGRGVAVTGNGALG
ncbi:MAG: hypothetical protein V2A58_05510 [Planctomycetota bacterium]